MLDDLARFGAILLAMHRHCSVKLVMCLLYMFLLVVDCAWGRSSGRSSWGKSCCGFSINSKCTSSCKRAKTRDDLRDGCSVNQDLYLLVCWERHEVGRRCCSGTVSSDCQSACRAVFIQEHSPSQTELLRVASHCTRQVETCVRNYTQSLPIRNMRDSLSCCEESGISDTCRTKCREALNTMTTENEIFNEMALHCGEQYLSTPLWQCFLRRSSDHIRQQYNMGNRFDLANKDSTRLMCCSKASTSLCGNLCVKTFSQRHVKMTDEFDQKCSYSLQEKELNICLEEVGSRCEPGCGRLSYCSNFHNHPEQLFRSCNQQSDSSAEQAVKLWEYGTISMPLIFDFAIPIKDIAHCESNKWKAIACTLHIKPCHHKSLSSSICRSDCLDILNKCLDTSRVSEPGITAETICSKLSFQDSKAPCVSLSLYTGSGNKRSLDQGQVITPCNPNPCNDSQVCIVSWKNCPLREANPRCQPFQCVPGCPLGEGVTQIVPLSTYVRVPNASDTDCHLVCQCDRSGVVHHCKKIGCFREDECVMSSGMIQSHGSTFSILCTRCACRSGHVTCTNPLCLRNEKSNPQRSLPCGCSADYAPVCGINGQTYPSVCLAKCAKLNDDEIFQGKLCSTKSPCLGVSCLPGERCVAKRQKCLWYKSTGCKQHECVKLKNSCEPQYSPVCDSTGSEVSNVCQLLLQKRTLAYRGRCLSYCRKSGPVCGVDGDGYASECAAWAAGVPADYSGPCRAVGSYQDTVMGKSLCPNVTCSNVYQRNSQLLTPPGACCPRCAGEIRLLMSPSLLESASASLPARQLTVADVLDALRVHIRVLYCEVFGYLNVLGDLTLLIMPIVNQPTSLQFEACMVETERLGSLLSSSNPTLTTYVALSVFVSADIRTCQLNPATTRSLSSTSPESLSCGPLVVVFVVLIHGLEHLHNL